MVVFSKLLWSCQELYLQVSSENILWFKEIYYNDTRYRVVENMGKENHSELLGFWNLLITRNSK
jgi:hypothetical protein